MLTPGTKLGRYEVTAPIGAGGMGEVYKARDSRLGRHVALKILPPEFATDSSRRYRFEAEAKAASALNHPNIVSVHDIGSEQGVPYIVSELVEGESLRSLINRGPVPVRKAIDLAVQILDGLAAAHSAGIVHRDLKPENIMVSQDGRIKILDFGLARRTAMAASAGEQSVTITASEPGTVLGTAAYMSPEQVRGSTVDHRSDIFSFGLIFYELLTSRRAFERLSAAETMSAIANDEPAEIDETLPIPFAVRSVIFHCFEKAPKERIQSAWDLAFFLEALQGPSASATHPAVPAVRKRRLLLAVLALVLAMVAAAGWWLYARLQSRIDSIAVLPFVNQSTDPTAEYLGDGLTQTLINRLSRLPGLKVKSLISVNRYRNQLSDLQKLGQDLGVQAVVTGQVQQRGQDLSISIELIDVRANDHVWGDKYLRKMVNLVTLPEELAREITGQLRLRLTGEEQQRLAKRYTDNPEAYQAYLKGRYYWNRRTEESIRKSITFFNEAIEKDPKYALAQVGLGDAYFLLTRYSGMVPAEGYARGLQAIRTALEMDGSLAEAHASLGYAKLNYELHLDEAEYSFKRAIELNPSYATAHLWYTMLLCAAGRFDEAQRQIERAIELEPLTMIMNTTLGRVLHLKGEQEWAIAQLRKTLDMDPTFAEAQFWLAKSYQAAGRYTDAIATLKTAISLRGAVQDHAALADALAGSGRIPEARKIAETLRQKRASPFELALIHVGLSEYEKAIDYLEEAHERHSPMITYIKVDPLLAKLRGNSRFDALVKRLGL